MLRKRTCLSVLSRSVRKRQMVLRSTESESSKAELPGWYRLRTAADVSARAVRGELFEGCLEAIKMESVAMWSETFHFAILITPDGWPALN